MDAKTVTSIETLLAEVRRDYKEWGTTTYPWFRGEPTKTSTPLLPKLFRRRHSENRLLQHFRMKAPSLGIRPTPPRDHTDQWLFLARHVGVPTRLLDWTEGLLVALYFALHNEKGQPREEEEGGTLWMLDPVELNRLSSSEPMEDNDFPLTWFSEESVHTLRGEVAEWLALATDKNIENKVQAFEQIRRSMKGNIGSQNIRRAWGERREGTEMPVAVHPTSIHPRITAQKSCFTIHGKKEEPLSQLVGPRVLRAYIVGPDSFERVRADLRLAGISYSTMFPDLDGLAVDLQASF